MIPKKSLGQNFLTNTGIVASIVDAASLVAGETVLEIGPGRGILTEELLKRNVRVIAVEKDGDLIPLLQEKFAKEIFEKRLTLIHDDVLNFQTLRTGVQPQSGGKNNDGQYKLVANIPYYITGQIIRKFLTSEKQPSKMVLLVQKEVAERIVARDGKESLLSLSVKAYGEPKYIKTVKAGSFTPAPSVDSAILLIDNISRKFFDAGRGSPTPSETFRTGSETRVRQETTLSQEERFFEILHAGFAHKRKQLFSNLRAVFDENILRNKMKESGISETVRAEDLSLSDWKKLSD
ncbi:MAG: 16S rRNA (adenine(1518)-N(6)/adenine(1519)-N(6))-dimethyltransferase RsmA [Candidatus Paceibacterota bacterium]|jgi:16S rRNA (adenine1518-N6/adenine1519-N6)-dimethyltransferase|nr:16S rRNA (adenine(1518)-N(6)/adenine(1519)-N(6))-dimethyltransferase RsmA [Candidatus Paceibacterota bacterium]